MSYLENYGCMSPVYAELRQGLGEHHASWSGLPQFTLPAGPVLRPGSTGARVGMLRVRLGLSPGEKFDKELALRLRQFQSAPGLQDRKGVVWGKSVAGRVYLGGVRIIKKKT